MQSLSSVLLWDHWLSVTSCVSAHPDIRDLPNTGSSRLFLLLQILFIYFHGCRSSPSIPLRQIRQTMSFRIETFTQNHCFQSQLESTKSSKCFSEMKNQYHATGVTFTNRGGGPWLWKGFRPERASSATNGEKSPNSMILRRMKRALSTASCQTITTKKSLRGSFLILFYDH